MKTHPKYQTTRINAGSPEELAMRINELELRGYEVIAKHDVEKESHIWVDNGYRDRDGAKYRYAGTDVHKSYQAAMRREVVQ